MKSGNCPPQNSPKRLYLLVRGGDVVLSRSRTLSYSLGDLLSRDHAPVSDVTQDRSQHHWWICIRCLHNDAVVFVLLFGETCVYQLQLLCFIVSYFLTSLTERSPLKTNGKLGGRTGHLSSKSPASSENYCTHNWERFILIDLQQLWSRRKGSFHVHCGFNTFVWVFNIVHEGFLGDLPEGTNIASLIFACRAQASWEVGNMRVALYSLPYFVLFLAITFEVSLHGVGGSLTKDTVKSWSTQVESYLLKLAEEGLKTRELQKLYDSANYTVEEKSGFDTINSVKSRLGNYFVKKENTARVSQILFLLMKYKYKATRSSNL